jgi:hypothetical protein
MAYGWTPEAIRALSMEDINAYLELIADEGESELQKECALRGIKYKPKQKLETIEFNKDLDELVKEKIYGKR